MHMDQLDTKQTPPVSNAVYWAMLYMQALGRLPWTSPGLSSMYLSKLPCRLAAPYLPKPRLLSALCGRPLRSAPDMLEHTVACRMTSEGQDTCTLATPTRGHALKQLTAAAPALGWGRLTEPHRLAPHASSAAVAHLDAVGLHSSPIAGP